MGSSVLQESAWNHSRSTGALRPHEGFETVRREIKAIPWQAWQTLPDLSPVVSVPDLRELPEDAVLP
jgi:hypothetical protein